MFDIAYLPSAFRLIRKEAPLFTPEIEKRVDELWQVATQNTGAFLYNGMIFSACTVKENFIEGFFIEYKYLIAQQMDARLKNVLNICPVSIVGYLTCQDGILFAKRQSWLATHAEQWSFSPSSYLSLDVLSHDGALDYDKAFLVSLKQEININPADLSEFSNYALVTDTNIDGNRISLIIKANVDMTSFAIKKAMMRAVQNEYSEIVAVPENELDLFWSTHVGEDMRLAKYLFFFENYLTLEKKTA